MEEFNGEIRKIVDEAVQFADASPHPDIRELYLAATDTDLDLLSATGISSSWLNERINRTRSRRTVVLLDCCFSGAFVEIVVTAPAATGTITGKVVTTDNVPLGDAAVTTIRVPATRSNSSRTASTSKLLAFSTACFQI